MKIGVPKEIKTHEYRVGMTPAGVAELVGDGHEVYIEAGAGDGVGFSDSLYATAGAQLLPSAEAVFAAAGLIVKVKEPLAPEYARLRRDQLLFTYLHLAADPAQARGLLASGATAIAYETVTAAGGGLPLLAPMSEVAGRMAIQVGATYLQKEHGGAGVLLGGVPGVSPAKVVIIGGGVAGAEAARLAIGAGADVTVLDRSLPRLRELAAVHGNALKTVFSTRDALEQRVADADLVIGSVLVPGASAPKLVTRDMVASMRPGSVLVDIAIDQGGCFETSRPTSHTDPVYVVDGVVHYCVTNMPGAVARTSTLALTNATLPFIRSIAALGWEAALRADPHLRNGLTVHAGALRHEVVARDLDMKASFSVWN
ncbi:MAG: alanine dehydrogenase [Solimonas sp.]